jgi:putative transposase
MKRTEVTLSPSDYSHLHQFIKSGKKTGKELERAYILMALHDNRPYKDIEAYYHVNRSTIWRTAENYKKKGLEETLKDKPRSGQPRKYTDKQEAEVIALACSDSPKGRKRWTIRLLTEHSKKIKGLEKINRETIRLILKKTNISLG